MGIWFMMLGFNLLTPAIMLGAGKLFLKKAPKDINWIFGYRTTMSMKNEDMKMKLGIAIALSHNAKLLILDEATSGLDPVVRDEVVEMFSDFTRDENHSILISSHIVSDLEKLCDYVAFLHKGKLLLCEEKDQLLAEYGLIHCTSEELQNLPAEAIKYKKENPYGIEAMVLRNAVPAGVNVSPISIEELFVFMVKEAR